MMFCQLLNTHWIFKRQAKALIRLRVCAGWSGALLVAHTTLLEIPCHGSFRKSIKTKCRVMLTRGGLTPAGQFSSSQLICIQTKARSCGYESFLTLLTLTTLHHLTSIFLNMKSCLKEKRFSNDGASFPKSKHGNLLSSTIDVYTTASNDGRSIITLAEAYVGKDWL